MSGRRGYGRERGSIIDSTVVKIKWSYPTTSFVVWPMEMSKGFIDNISCVLERFCTVFLSNFVIYMQRVLIQRSSQLVLSSIPNPQYNVGDPRL